MVNAQNTSDEVFQSTIDEWFRGWRGRNRTIVKLRNGQIWQQSESCYKDHLALRPDTVIFKSGEGYKMKVEGTNEAVEVKNLNTFIEVVDKIDGRFEGWGGSNATIVKLRNGSIWEQSEYNEEYSISDTPEVVILKLGGVYKMLVQGTVEAVEVKRLK